MKAPKMDCPQKVRHFLGAFFMGKSKYSVDFKLKAIKRYHKGDIGTKRIGVCGSLVRKWIKFLKLTDNGFGSCKFFECIQRQFYSISRIFSSAKRQSYI